MPRLIHESGEVINTYVYQTDIIRDLFEAISEYAGEFEHAMTREPFSGPLTQEFILERKKLLWRDCGEYMKGMGE